MRPPCLNKLGCQKVFFFLLVMVCFLAFPAWASPKKENQKFKKPVTDPDLPKKYVSSHFEIYTRESKKYAKQVATVLEIFRKTFVKGFGSSRCFGRPLKILKPQVFIFPQKSDFVAFCQKHKPAMVNREAFFDWWWGPGMERVKTQWHFRLISFVHSSFKETQKFLIHELTHIFLNYYLDRIPLWLDEGIATYMQTALIQRGRLKQGIPAYGFLKELRQAYREKRNIPLKELFKMGPDDDSKFTPLHYAQSWALVHFLLSNKRSVRAFWAFLKKVEKTKKYEDAFWKIFFRRYSEIALHQLEKALKAYVFRLK